MIKSLIVTELVLFNCFDLAKSIQLMEKEEERARKGEGQRTLYVIHPAIPPITWNNNVVIFSDSIRSLAVLVAGELRLREGYADLDRIMTFLICGLQSFILMFKHYPSFCRSSRIVI